MNVGTIIVIYMVKPFLFTDGYIYACPSAELSIENNYNYVPESQFAVCDIDGIEEFYAQGPTLRHHKEVITVSTLFVE